jgi:hypothetical protein
MITIWILIYTVGGIFEKPKIFITKKEAEIQREKLKNGSGLKGYDDVEIFHKRLRITT